MTEAPYSCPHCNAFLLDHPELKEWKKCPGCGYCTKSGKITIYPVGNKEDGRTDFN